MFVRRSRNFSKTLLSILSDILRRKQKSYMDFTFTQLFAFTARPTPFLSVNCTSKSQCRKPVCSGKITKKEFILVSIVFSFKKYLDLNLL